MIRALGRLAAGVRAIVQTATPADPYIVTVLLTLGGLVFQRHMDYVTAVVDQADRTIAERHDEIAELEAGIDRLREVRDRLAGDVDQADPQPAATD